MMMLTGLAVVFSSLMIWTGYQIILGPGNHPITAHPVTASQPNGNKSSVIQDYQIQVSKEAFKIDHQYTDEIQSSQGEDKPLSGTVPWHYGRASVDDFRNSFFPEQNEEGRVTTVGKYAKESGLVSSRGEDHRSTMKGILNFVGRYQEIVLNSYVSTFHGDLTILSSLSSSLDSIPGTLIDGSNFVHEHIPQDHKQIESDENIFLDFSSKGIHSTPVGNYFKTRIPPFLQGQEESKKLFDHSMEKKAQSRAITVNGEPEMESSLESVADKKESISNNRQRKSLNLEALYTLYSLVTLIAHQSVEEVLETNNKIRITETNDVKPNVSDEISNVSQILKDRNIKKSATYLYSTIIYSESKELSVSSYQPLHSKVINSDNSKFSSRINTNLKFDFPKQDNDDSNSPPKSVKSADLSKEFSWWTYVIIAVTATLTSITCSIVVAYSATYFRWRQNLRRRKYLESLRPSAGI